MTWPKAILLTGTAVRTLREIWFFLPRAAVLCLSTIMEKRGWALQGLLFLPGNGLVPLRKRVIKLQRPASGMELLRRLHAIVSTHHAQGLGRSGRKQRMVCHSALRCLENLARTLRTLVLIPFPTHAMASWELCLAKKHPATFVGCLVKSWGTSLPSSQWRTSTGTSAWCATYGGRSSVTHWWVRRSLEQHTD